MHCRPALAAADVTVATQAAFDSINNLFGGALPHGLGWEAGAEPTATVRFGEPTITLSSRAAFDAVNMAFQDRHPQEPSRRPSGLPRPQSVGQSLQTLTYSGTGSKAALQAEDDQTGAFQVVHLLKALKAAVCT